MSIQNWAVERELHLSDTRIVLLTHSATGPGERIHCVAKPTLSAMLMAAEAPLYGAFMLDKRREICGSLGSLVLMPPGIPLRISSKSVSSRTLFVCEFGGDSFKFPNDPPSIWGPHALKTCLDITSHYAHSCVRRITKEMVNPGFCGTLLMEGLIRALAVELHRSVMIDEETHRGLSPQQLKRVKMALAETCGATPTIPDLATICGISPRHLTRSFRISTGQSISTYANGLRFDRAKTLLQSSRYRISEIANTLGFKTTSSFSVAFLKLAGESPNRYRRRLAENSRSN